MLAKVANCRTVLLRALRDKPECVGYAEMGAAAARLARLADSVQSAKLLEAVRGHEGDAARAYFDVFDHLITECEGRILLSRAQPAAAAR